MKFTRWFFFLWTLLAIGSHAVAQDEDWMKKPNPPRLVNDYAGVLVQSEVTDLERKLVAYDDSTSNQVAVLIVKTTGDYDIAEAATRVLRTWGIGAKGKNNGILIIVATEDRRMRIEVGSGLEGSVPDAVAWGIVDKVLKPAFREGHYYQGIDEAVDKIIQAAAGEYKGVPRRKQGPGGGNIMGIIIIILIILFIVGRGGGRGGGGRVISRRGSGVFDAILGGMIGGAIGRSSGGWGGGGGGFGGGSSGGGGFGGFGGGSGMGGGASGSW